MRTRFGLGWSKSKPETIHNLYLSRTIHSNNRPFDGKSRSQFLSLQLKDVRRKLTQYKDLNQLLIQRLKQHQSANDALKNLLKQYQTVSDVLKNLLKQHQHLDQHLEYHLNQDRHLDQHPKEGHSAVIPSDSSRKDPVLILSDSSRHELVFIPSDSSRKDPVLILSDSSRHELVFIPSDSSRKDPAPTPPDPSRHELVFIPSDSFRKDPFEEDPVQKDPFKKGPFTKDPFKKDPFKKDPFKKDPFKKDPFKKDPLKKDTFQKGPVMHAWIQFITTPTVDTPGTALILHFDQQRYIIGNIHEGFSRACIQMGIKFSKVSDIFITGKTEWQNTGGLMGLVMTIADIAASSATERSKKRPWEEEMKPSLTIHGGDNIAHTLAIGRQFILRKALPVHVKKYPETDSCSKSEQSWEPDWADSNLQVWAMVIEPSSVEKPTTPVGPKSPAKRSFDDFARESSVPIERAKVAESRGSPPSPQKDHCANVVMDMFASNWRKDYFDELPLAEVAMPARIFVRNKYTNEIERYTGALHGGGPVPDIKVLVNKPWPLRLDLPYTKPSHKAVSYILRCQRKRGKFSAENAKALNVPPGILRKKLSEGLDVQLKDGTIVKSEMILGKSKDGGGVVVADLPSHDYVHGLLSRPEWKAVEVMTGVEAVIWILGSGVSKNEDLQNFINDHKHLKHIISSPDHCPNYLAFSSSAVVSGRLNQLDPLRYPIPIHDNVTLPHNGQRSMEKNCASEIILAECGLKVQLEPSVSIRKEQIVSPMDLSEQKLELPESVRILADHARQEIASGPMQTEMKNQHLPSPDSEIICLGTGSAIPSKHRNVSGTLLRVPGVGSYLLDCGENTLGQLRRLYSPTELGDVLRDLKLIWISHLHADHHLGTISVIKAWYEEVYGKSNPAQEPSRDSPFQLCVVSNKRVLNYLREYSSVENFGFHRLVPIASGKANEASVRHELRWYFKSEHLEDSDSLPTNTLKTITGLTDIATCSVTHCYDSQAVTLTFPTGFKFSYSGDCRPSRDFIEIGQGSTLLLHEATFADERQDDAQEKKHCTISEAIAVGKQMGARRILLTHFSQRYSKIPIGMGSTNVEPGFDEDAKDLAGETNRARTPAEDINIDISKDNMPPSQRANAQPIPSTLESTSHVTNPPILQWGATEPVPEDVPVEEPKVGVAFDYMNVKVKDIMLLEKYTPAFLNLLAGAEEPEETQAKALGVKPEIAKKKIGEENAMFESGSNRKIAGGEPANGVESIALDDGVGIVQVRSTKQEMQEKSEFSDPVMDLETSLPDTEVEAAVTDVEAK